MELPQVVQDGVKWLLGALVAILTYLYVTVLKRLDAHDEALTRLAVTRAERTELTSAIEGLRRELRENVAGIHEDNHQLRLEMNAGLARLLDFHMRNRDGSG